MGWGEGFFPPEELLKGFPVLEEEGRGIKTGLCFDYF